MTFHVSSYIFFPLSPSRLVSSYRSSDFSRRYFSPERYLHLLFFVRLACLYRFEILCLHSLFLSLLFSSLTRILFEFRDCLFPPFFLLANSAVVTAIPFSLSLRLQRSRQVRDPGTLYQLVPLLDAFNFRSRFQSIKTL